MNYKSIIKSRRWRLKILKMLQFIPDTWMIRWQYRIKTKRPLHLNPPELFTEKLQWYKLYYHHPLMSQCADKYKVRTYVSEKGLSKILPKLHTTYENTSDVNLSNLPDSFVIKASIGGGGNDVLVVSEKSQWTENTFIERIKQFPLGLIRSNPGREWAYLGNYSILLIEENLNDYATEPLTEYKFYSFYGKPQLIKVSRKDMTSNTQKKAFYDMHLNRLEARELDGSKPLEFIAFPQNMSEMIRIVEILSEDFPHVRIDLYNIDGQIYFGEMTFYDMSGYVNYSDVKFDQDMGKLFTLPKVWV